MPQSRSHHPFLNVRASSAMPGARRVKKLDFLTLFFEIVDVYYVYRLQA